MGIGQKWLCSWARWWNTQIKVNPTQVSEEMNPLYIDNDITMQIIEDPGDLEGWEKIKDEDKEDVKKLIREFSRDSPGAGAKKGKAKTPAKTTPPTKAAAAKGTKRPAKEEEEESEEKTAASSSPSSSSPPKV